MFGAYSAPIPYTQMQPSFYPQPVPDQLSQLRQAQQISQPSQQAVQQPATGICWVQSEREAWEYLLAPNSAVALWDANNPTIYFKQSDASGKPIMKIYDLVERAEKPQAEQPKPDWLTRLENVEAQLRELTKPAPAPTKRGKESDNG